MTDIFKEFDKVLTLGQPLLEVLEKVDSPLILATLMAASIDSWCTDNGYDPCDMAEKIAEAIRNNYSEVTDRE